MKNLLLAIVLSFSILGCSTYQQTTGKMLASVAITVDGSMKGWASWVKMGKATQSEQDNVKSAYEKYQLAMQTAEDAYLAVLKLDTTDTENALKVALAALDGAKADLVNIVQQLTH